MAEEREIKVSKSYSLPPSQVEWLRLRAAQESLDGTEPVSASDVLTRIIEYAISKAEKDPSFLSKTARKTSPRIQAVKASALVA